MSEEPVVRCTCPAPHGWRAYGKDDPEGTEPSAAHDALAAAAAFAGTEARPLERTVAKHTVHHTRWVAEEHPKDLIVLHFTAGPGHWLPSSYWGKCNVSWWAPAEGAEAADPVKGYPGVGSTAFGIGRDGRIEQYYPPQCWNHHASGGSAVHRRSIGIELANLGWVIEMTDGDGNILGYRACCSPRPMWATWDELPADLRDEMVPAEAVNSDAALHLTRHFKEIAWPIERGGEPITHRIAYWHTYSRAQIDSLIDLVDALCDAYGIPRRALPEDQRFREMWQCGAGCTFSGIVSHMNFIQGAIPGRAGAKWDPGPAFPWDEFLHGIGAPVGQITRYWSQAVRAGAIREATLLEEAASSQVRLLEQRLNLMGHSCGSADGIRDELTRRGIRSFQERHGMEADGEITVELLEKVDEVYQTVVRRMLSGTRGL
jgi:N-acetyl-anhydromuramyl-L-alanine amidase AmpD